MAILKFVAQNLKTRDFISALHEFLSVVEIEIELFVSAGEKKDSAEVLVKARS